MWRNLVEVLRGRAVDHAKAQAYLRALVAEYDPALEDSDATQSDRATEPSVLVGIARDASGYDRPVRVPRGDSAHWLVQGSTGAGKSRFAAHLFAERLRIAAPVGVIDFKNDLFQACLRWAGVHAYGLTEAERPAFIRSLAVVNPFGSDALVPLNVCRPFARWTPEVQAYEITTALSRLFDAGLTFHGENILRHLLLLLIGAELSLVEAADVLQDEVLRGILVERSRNEAVREFFHRTYPELPMVAKQALCTRLQALLLPENVKLMMGADSLIDLPDILHRGAPFAVFLGKGNVPEEQAEMLAALFLNLFFQAAYSAQGRLRPFTMILDEFFHVLTPSLTRRVTTALTTLRSYRVNLVLVLHTFSQVEPTLRETILGNCDAMAMFRTSGKNAEWLGDFLPNHDSQLTAEMLRRTGEFPSHRAVRAAMIERLQRLPGRHCFWYDRRRPHRAILLRVPDVPEPHEALGLSAGALDRFMDEYRIGVGGYALSRPVLRQQVAARQERLRQLVRPPIRIVHPARDPASEPLPASRRRPRLG